MLSSPVMVGLTLILGLVALAIGVARAWRRDREWLTGIDAIKSAYAATRGSGCQRTAAVGILVGKGWKPGVARRIVDEVLLRRA